MVMRREFLPSIDGRVLVLSSYSVWNRATFSDGRSNFHTLVANIVTKVLVLDNAMSELHYSHRQRMRMKRTESVAGTLIVPIQSHASATRCLTKVGTGRSFFVFIAPVSACRDGER
jgi:hypothetical protein